MDPAKERDIEEEYLSSLMDLNVNSKPLINMLTMLADENLEYAHVIVKAVEKHLAKVSPDVKLPILYLIDSIVKNVGKSYKQLFAQNIVNIFCGVFEKVNEKVREKMFNLRQTWNEVFPQTKLYALDVKVNVMDNNWPITAKIVPKSVHVNPNFLKNKPVAAIPPTSDQEELLNQMKAKERELIELKQRKIELELMVTKKKIAESEREMRSGLVNPQTSFIAPITVAPVSLPSIAVPQRMFPPHQGRVRVAPASAEMIAAARSRDPRLVRARAQQQLSQHSSAQMPQPIVHLPAPSITKSMPRIPKFSQYANKTARNDGQDRDPRNRRNKDKEEKSKGNASSKDKHKDKSKSSSLRPHDHKKSGSSDDSSPRKKGEDDKKSPKSSASRHRSHSHSSPAKAPSQTESKDVDSRLSSELLMKPDSTTNKDRLTLNGEGLQSSHEMNASEDNAGTSTIRDTDLRFIDGTKKRTMNPEPSESEPTSKKNRAEDLLFGSKDVDYRSLGEPAQSSDRRAKSKEKADFEAVRAKLNATKEKNKHRAGIKLLDEFPAMPASENGNTELVKRILGRKDKHKEVKEPEEFAKITQIVEEIIEVQPPPPKQTRFNPIQTEERMDDVADLGNLTAAELRKSSIVPASIRKEKRKGSKWNQPESNWPMNSNSRQQGNTNNLPPPGHMMPQHFINPWESNPMIQAMQKQSQMPLVIPQSISHPVLNTKLRTLRLDGTKDHLLRFYHETAIIFNEQGDPHDIKFSAGQSRVIIDDQYTVDLNFNDSYKPIFIESTLHQIKFGSPTRELYIDHHFYECYFNNQPTQIVLNDKLRMVRIEGNAPEVKIGRKRNDLVLGLINIVIDAEVMVPIFLDTSIQYFEFKGKIFTLQFADFFQSVIINNEPFKVEYGGLPKNFTLNGQKHFIRFTGFPEEFTPGRVNMKGMRRTHLFRSCKTPPLIMSLESNDGLDIGQLVENDMRGQQIMNNSHAAMQSNSLAPNMIPGIGHEAQGAPALGVPNLDINDLLKKLVATGIIGGANAEAPSTSKNNGKKDKTPERPEDSRRNRTEDPRRTEEKRPINPVSFARPESLKKRQNGIVDTLYLGIQCSSCGLRFPPEQTMKYSQHLDWHFRQNRRERDSKRRAHFRKWYYNRSDWIKYEEIEDLEERDKNFFETQMESMGDDSNNAGGNLENSAEVSCPAGPLNVKHICEVCHDEFDQFFDEETEEWHLRSALKVEDKFFHPICYEDFKASLTLDESALNEGLPDDAEAENDDVEMSEASEVVIKAEPQESGSNPPGIGEDDDDVMILPSEEQVVTEILDESEVVEESVADTTVADDDVMIQEPKIDTEIVPDDDDEDYRPTTSNEPLPEDFVVKIKEEPKDDGYEDLANEEDAFVEVNAVGSDDVHDDAYINSPKAPFQPAQDENAVFDEASLMMPSPSANEELSHDSDYENNSRPESGGAPLIGGNKKLKIVLSSLAQTNLLNKNNSNSNVNDQNENSNLDSVNKLDTNSVELQSDVRKDDACASEEPEIEYQVKPGLQGVKFERNYVPVKRGLDNSGLCSIM